MRVMALVLIAACSTDATDAPIAPDALAPDAPLAGNGTATGPCYFWGGPTRCAPRCANRTLLGRYVFGEHNTCETAAGMCPTANMTANATTDPSAGCCVVVGAEVDFYSCQ